MKEALFYKKLGDARLQCELCPHNCVIKPDNVGICGVRRNLEGTLYSIIYARATSVAMDPIEKKPLYHFHPGTQILSLGTNGCNFKCPYCQNWHISQEEAPTQELSPEHAVELASSRNAVGIAYTYNEPIIWYEYVLDTARLAREKGLKNVLVTNGFINPAPLAELLAYVDALNIDLKSIEDDFYRKLCKGRLQPVLDAAVQAKKVAHLEVTNLVIPGYNDREEQFHQLGSWVKENLGAHTPVHLSAYFPHYRLRVSPTSLETLKRAYGIISRYADYVYLGNVAAEEGSDTRCKRCGAQLISRHGYSIQIVGLVDGSCAQCGADNNIIGDWSPSVKVADDPGELEGGEQ